MESGQVYDKTTGLLEYITTDRNTTGLFYVKPLTRKNNQIKMDTSSQPCDCESVLSPM